MNTIQVNTCTLSLDGAQLITIIEALHELPHKRVVQLLTEIQRQILAQMEKKDDSAP